MQVLNSCLPVFGLCLRRAGSAAELCPVLVDDSHSTLQPFVHDFPRPTELETPSREGE